MANNLRNLEVRLIPGEREEYALPFESVQVLTHLRTLEQLSVQVIGAGTNLLEPFCNFQNLQALEVRDLCAIDT